MTCSCRGITISCGATFSSSIGSWEGGALFSGSSSFVSTDFVSVGRFVFCSCVMGGRDSALSVSSGGACTKTP